MVCFYLYMLMKTDLNRKDLTVSKQLTTLASIRIQSLNPKEKEKWAKIAGIFLDFVCKPHVIPGAAELLFWHQLFPANQATIII